MAKLKGPGMSFKAKGSIGDALTFSNWRGRSYGKRKSHPKNPRSGKQIASRAMIWFLSKQWAGTAMGDKASFAQPAAANETSPYHAYLKYNQQRWQLFLSPSKDWPAAESAAPGQIAFASNTVHGFRVNVDLFTQAANFNWGVIAYASRDNGFTPGISNAWSIDPWSAAADLNIWYGPFTKGQWYMRFHLFSEDGLPSTVHTQQQSVNITG